MSYEDGSWPPYETSPEWDRNKLKLPVPCGYCGEPIPRSPGNIMQIVHLLVCDKKPKPGSAITQLDRAPGAGDRNN